jgi:hypothetical protein
MKTFKKTLHNQNGATIVFVAVVLGLLVMFTALAIDVNHLYAVRNELQNAADAGALAGASVLFDGDGSLNREAARDEGLRVTVANGTGNQLVDIVLDNVQTGHWSFSNKTFTPSDATVQTTWQERSFADLDIDPAFINAVRVQADRDDTPSFFAGIFGYQDFFVAADAVAYIGFAGTIYPNEIDRPIAICEDAIKKDGAYNCNMGRMLNSGGNANTAMTAMWTNYTQDPCSTASNSDMQGLTKDCAAGNPDPLNFGEGMGSQNGVQDNVLGNVADCWTAAADSDGDGNPDSFWPLVLPVIDCNESNTCAPLVGAVEVNVVWIQYKNDPQMNDIPTVMEDWNCTPATSELADRLTCWKSFVDHFNLENVTGPPATDADYEEMYQQKNLYFLPSCEVHEPIGNTGGENFGILAKIPKLVE